VPAVGKGEHARAGDRGRELVRRVGRRDLVALAGEQAIRRGDPAELAAIAESSERLLASQSQTVREAAVTGFLDGLMHRCRADPGQVPFERLARSLGPVALAACRRLDEKLGTSTPGL